MNTNLIKKLKPIVLSIGGFDPSSGAGITTDLKVLQELEVYGLSAISAITAQNSEAVFDVFTPPTDFFKYQIEVLLKDVTPSVIKIGMLSNKYNISVLKEQLMRLNKKKVVLDPVFISSSGMQLLSRDGQQGLIDNLLPLALVLTPNINEAEHIAGIKIETLADAQKAASIINDLGPKWVVIKGGHHEYEKDFVEDLVYNGVDFFTLKSKRQAKCVRGTGCIFSSAISAYLAKGLGEIESITKAHEFVQSKIKEATHIGKGNPQT